MSEALQVTGEIEAVSRNDRGTGVKINGVWYNSTAKTAEIMGMAQKGHTVTMHFLENESNGRTYRNVIGFGFEDPDGEGMPPVVEEDVDMDAPAAPAAPAPKPRSVPPPRLPANKAGIDKKHIVQIQGKDFVTFNGVLDAAHKKGLKSLTLKEMTVTPEQVWCIAQVAFKDGTTFEATGSVNKANSAANMGAKWPVELAQTRAFGRAMRIGLNLEYNLQEEMDE
jgi:hypothetical protein